MKYLKYLKYIVIHKWFVMLECFKVGLYWQGIIHDMSKLQPDEFIPYANYFYDGIAGIKKGRDGTGYYKPTDTGNLQFDIAWLLHQKRNRHHWQFWVIPKDSSGVRIFKIPHRYVQEMVCDWIGAGKAQGHFSPLDDKYFETRIWYHANKGKMQLHPNTRTSVEAIIQYYSQMDD